MNDCSPEEAGSVGMAILLIKSLVMITELK